MVTKTSFGTLCVFLCAMVPKISGSPQKSNLVVHETTPHLPQGWRYYGPANDVEPLSLRIALREPYEEYLEIANEVSDPQSSKYGQYLSAENLRRALPNFQPAADEVRRWLMENGVEDINTQGEWVDFTFNVGQAKNLFNATFSWYSYHDEAPILRTKSYSIPQSLRGEIHFVLPATLFIPTKRNVHPAKTPYVRRNSPPAGLSTTCATSTCPNNLTQRYNINYHPPDNRSGSSIGITGFLDEIASQPDVDIFLQKYGPNPNGTKGYKFQQQFINGGKSANSPSEATFEAQLDLEYSMSLAYPLDVTFFSTGGRPPTMNPFGNATLPADKSRNEPYLAFLQYLLAQRALPQVISISYGDDEQMVPKPYAERVCNLFGRLAARGVSVISASGDGGASGTGGSHCIGPDGKRRFIPVFPSTCPWVTSVGATAMDGNAASYSGGGFSNYFPRPQWQGKAVSGYMGKLKETHKQYYNPAGRACPDVSLVGDDYLIEAHNSSITTLGTSAAAPVFGAMIALINDLRLRAGKPALGFLNPLLYSKRLEGVFRDVTKGVTEACSDGLFYEPGWESLPGWDAATGLGEPNFAELRKALEC